MILLNDIKNATFFNVSSAINSEVGLEVVNVFLKKNPFFPHFLIILKLDSLIILVDFFHKDIFHVTRKT